MSRCQHPNFKVNAEINRLTDVDGGAVNAFAVDIKVNCAKCEMPFEWLGLKRGISSAKPMVSFDRLELRAPIMPVEEL